MPGVGVTFGGKDTGLDALNKKVAKSAGALTESYKAGSRELKQLESIGVRAFRNTETSAEKLKRTLRGINEAHKTGRLTQEQANRATRHANRTLGQQSMVLNSLRTSVSSYAQSWLSIQGGVAAVTANLRVQRELIDRTAGVQAQFAKSQRELFSQFPGATSAQRQQLADKLLSKAIDLNIRPVELTRAGSELAGATTGRFETREDLIFRTLKQIAPLFISKPEEAGKFGGALQSFFQTTQGIGLADEEAFSLLLQARGQARIVSEEKLKNFIPAVRALEATRGGETDLPELKTLAALFAQVGSRAEDPDAEKTRTALVKLLQVLETRFPGQRLGQQLEAAAALSPAQFEEFAKPFGALRGIGPVLKDILTGRLQGAFQEIVESIKIDVEGNKEFMQQMLTGNATLVQDTASIKESVKQQLILLSDPAKAGVARRLLPSEAGPGRLRTTIPHQAFALEPAVAFALSLGIPPERVEAAVTQLESTGGIRPLGNLALIDALRALGAGLMENTDSTDKLRSALEPGSAKDLPTPEQ